jgi:hypothetical protein
VSHLRGVVRERDAQVTGEPQVVVPAVLHPGGEGVPFLLELPVPGGVDRDPGLRGLAVPVLVLLAGLGTEGAVPCLAGGFRGLAEGQERVDGLLRPCPVEACTGVGDGGELPEQVSVMAISP